MLNPLSARWRNGDAEAGNRLLSWFNSRLGLQLGAFPLGLDKATSGFAEPLLYRSRYRLAALSIINTRADAIQMIATISQIDRYWRACVPSRKPGR